MEYRNSQLEDINDQYYENIDEYYEIPVRKESQPEDKNPQVTVNLPGDKANEKAYESIHKCKNVSKFSSFFYNVNFSN